MPTLIELADAQQIRWTYHGPTATYGSKELSCTLTLFLEKEEEAINFPRGHNHQRRTRASCVR